jgi:hypothetical protein
MISLTSGTRFCAEEPGSVALSPGSPGTALAERGWLVCDGSHIGSFQHTSGASISLSVNGKDRESRGETTRLVPEGFQMMPIPDLL